MRHNTQLVGIINITPDSFSDGGQALDAKAALAAIDRLIQDGAAVIDIGAESTRPGATPLTHAEEWARLLPVLEALPKDAIISLDTRHGETARKALAYNVSWINDVSGFSSTDMIAAVRESDCTLVMMHSLTVPADPKVTMMEGDVVQMLIDWAIARLKKLEAAGIAPSRIIFDPGIGFGKTAEQSLAILREVERFHALGIPLLIGHSRKSFLGKESSIEARDRATLEISHQLAGQGVDYLRVHNVALHKEMLTLRQAS